MALSITVCCDQCGDLLTGVSNTKIPTPSEIQEFVKYEGWLYQGFDFYCPLCQSKYELKKEHGNE